MNTGSNYMHTWHDDWPYWNDLYEAQQFIEDYVYKHSRCKLISKEKLGTLRYEWMFPYGSGIFIRPWTCIRIPFLWKEIYKEDEERINVKWVFDRTKILGWPVWRWCDSWVHKKWEQWGWKTLDKAIILSCRKWPNCRKEILSDWVWFKY